MLLVDKLDRRYGNRQRASYLFEKAGLGGDERCPLGDVGRLPEPNDHLAVDVERDVVLSFAARNDVRDVDLG
jgi:hypothetical protein